MDEQGLQVLVAFDREARRGNPGPLRRRGRHGGQILEQRPANIGLAGFADRIERPFPLLPAQLLQLVEAVRLPEIIAEDGDVDVLRKPPDQPESLRKRRATLEKQARAIGETVEQRIERPADPEVLFDILRCRADPLGGGVKQSRARFVVRSQYLVIGGVHAALASGITTRAGAGPASRKAASAIRLSGRDGSLWLGVHG